MASRTSLPKYRHYKPKDLAVVRIDGRDHYLGRYDSPESWEKYHRLLAERSVSGSVSSSPSLPSDPTISGSCSINELILAFWRYGEGYYRRADGTPTGELENYRHAFRALKAMFGSTPARDFGPKALKLVRQSMVDSGLARTVINRRTQRLIHLFGFGVENELVPPDVHHGLKAIKSLRKGRTDARETEPVRPVPDDVVEATKPFLSRQLQACVNLQRLTGMRSGEVVSMRTGDIDMSKEAWEYQPGRHKGEHLNKARVVHLGPRAQEILRPWLRQDPSEYLFSPLEAEAHRRGGQRRQRKTPLTPSQKKRRPKAQPKRSPGKQYDNRSYAHAVARACKKAFPHPNLSSIRAKDLTPEQRDELKAWHKRHRWHPHQLRHSAATAVRKEFGLEVARVILGHSSPLVTALYAEADQEKARQAVKAIG
ncbi:tyrosine-type recombinase/integrase [Singulisphaera sp. PoT]|uniref:tyrosine-type recombinase/integrase n=1 Tax=Singulisphaera sp. PoT TaxID=3411797 RepID=UPI003BF5A4AF